MTVTREREINRRVEFTTKRPEEEETGYQGNWRERNEKKKNRAPPQQQKIASSQATQGCCYGNKETRDPVDHGENYH